MTQSAHAKKPPAAHAYIDHVMGMLFRVANEIEGEPSRILSGAPALKIISPPTSMAARIVDQKRLYRDYSRLLRLLGYHAAQNQDMLILRTEFNLQARDLANIPGGLAQSTNYQRLHKLCAHENMKLETLVLQMQAADKPDLYMPALKFTFNAAYAASPDADFWLKPGKSPVVQYKAFQPENPAL